MPKRGELNFLFNQWRIPNIILREARKKKQIVYGARAMNIQVPMFFNRPTFDYDVFTKKPKQTAHQMQLLLDKEISGGRDEFYSKRAKHEGTHKVMHKGKDGRKGTKDDFNIVDYTRMPRTKVPVRIYYGVRYRSLPSMVRHRKKILKDPESKYRHEKDKEDIERIRYGRLMKGKKW
jgi:hypothetical protein